MGRLRPINLLKVGHLLVPASSALPGRQSGGQPRVLFPGLRGRLVVWLPLVPARGDDLPEPNSRVRAHL